MAKTYYWSDLHLGHQRVAETRGFSTVQEHDEHIAAAWRRTVKENDIVWVLGDISGGSHEPALELISTLPGRKKIIWGNHDKGHSAHQGGTEAAQAFLKVFESADSVGRRRVDGMQFMLSHFPYTGERGGRQDRYPEFRLRDLGQWLVHGHVHQEWSLRGRQINVGVNRWMDGPVPESTILTIIMGAEPETVGARSWELDPQNG